MGRCGCSGQKTSVSTNSAQISKTGISTKVRRTPTPVKRRIVRRPYR